MDIVGRKDVRPYKIYALYNNVTDDMYIGCTCLTLKKRLSLHHSHEKKENSKLYVKMGEIGFNNFKIVELLSANTNLTDAHKTECEFIQFFKPTLNSIITGKYITQDGPFDRKAYSKFYNYENKEIINEKNRNNYYQKLKHKRQEKVECECGVIITNYNVKRHLKTEKHKKLLKR